jgi:hypothetical protein
MGEGQSGCASRDEAASARTAHELVAKLAHEDLEQRARLLAEALAVVVAPRGKACAGLAASATAHRAARGGAHR